MKYSKVPAYQSTSHFSELFPSPTPDPSQHRHGYHPSSVLRSIRDPSLNSSFGLPLWTISEMSTDTTRREPCPALALSQTERTPSTYGTVHSLHRWSKSANPSINHQQQHPAKNPLPSETPPGPLHKAAKAPPPTQLPPLTNTPQKSPDCRHPPQPIAHPPLIPRHQPALPIAATPSPRPNPNHPSSLLPTKFPRPNYSHPGPAPSARTHLGPPPASQTPPYLPVP
jgi:hypothetical protein